MPTSASPSQLDNRAAQVRFSDMRMIVALADGREIGMPGLHGSLVWRTPRLRSAPTTKSLAREPAFTGPTWMKISPCHACWGCLVSEDA